MHTPNCDRPVLLLDRSQLPLLARRGFYFADGVLHQCSHNVDRGDASFLSPYKLGLYRREEKDDKGNITQPYYCNIERAETFFVVDYDGVCKPLFILSPCGKCDLCHMSKREDISSRLDAECTLWSCPPLFVTLTYHNGKLPSDGVSKEHIVDFIKRLKYYLHKYDYNPFFRYYLSAEYGHAGYYIDSNGVSRKGSSRPHYHAIFFGIQVAKNKIDEIRNIFLLAWSDDRRKESTGTFIYNRQLIDDRCYGNVDVQFLRSSSAGSRYASKYLHKKQNVPAGKNNTFKSFSRRPAIGYKALNKHILDLFRNQHVNKVSLKSFDGSLIDLRLTKYFFHKVFPTMSRIIPIKVRKDLYRAENCLSVFASMYPLLYDHWICFFQPIFERFRFSFRNQPVNIKLSYDFTEYNDIITECYDCLSSFIPDWNLIEHIDMARDIYLSKINQCNDLTYKKIRAKYENNQVERFEHLY